MRIHFSELFGCYVVCALEAFDKITRIGDASPQSDLRHGQIMTVQEQIFRISESVVHDKLIWRTSELGF